MARRKLLILGAGIGTLLGVGLSGRLLRKRDRLDLYFEDGSMVSFPGGSTEAALVMPYAREALRAAQ